MNLRNSSLSNEFTYAYGHVYFYVNVYEYICSLCVWFMFVCAYVVGICVYKWYQQ